MSNLRRRFLMWRVVRSLNAIIGMLSRDLARAIAKGDTEHAAHLKRELRRFRVRLAVMRKS